MSPQIRRGFTLVEVMAATALMAALLVPLFLIIQYSSRTIYRSTNDIMAASLAMAKMEELRSLPYFQLENILYGLNPQDPYRQNNPNAINFLRGPFEPYPPRPDIAEPAFYKSSSTTFHRYTFLSYFPQANPDPNSKDFEKLKKRIRVQVRIFWKDRLSTSVSIDQDLSLETIVHDEGYNPKPAFNSFFKDPLQ